MVLPELLGSDSKDGHHIELNKSSLRAVFEGLPDPIFIIDPSGTVLLSNSTTALTLGMSLDQLIGANVRELVDKGIYNRSYALEAVQKKAPVSGLVRTRLNLTFLSTSTPILDENNEVKLILTTGKFLDLDDKFGKKPGERARQVQDVMSLPHGPKEPLTVIAESPVMRQVLLKAYRVAQTDTIVLLTGETGTGKEVLARYIHRHSKRANEAFITVNCAALPEHLVESELFGYEKGAFTGAKPEGKAGLFECADKGTLFLDEVGELPIGLQGKLLRVLETGEVRRVGGNQVRSVNVRVIAATNRNLEDMVRNGEFRSDLYYRLSVFPIHLPPLRERPEDIVALSFTFLEEFNSRYGADCELDYQGLQSLLSHDWPGNVRELRNVIERMVINSSIEGVTTPRPDYHGESPALASYRIFKLLGLEGTLREVLQKVEEQYIEYVLQECGGKISKAAERLGIYRTVLYRKLKAYKEKKTQ
ncbi:MAG: hypothetical protein PWR22_1590 [Moorella sp. (in: firmicutes)]|jgi:transcriptional regulator with PAS, ATPase and Fis domain|uniref:sigma-54 interaction domain-containing protein n=1 Tax=unclassified Neomoorella TaxID=2676739 RepID=UPI0010FFC720|nr:MULTISPECIES: sigma 54-interacting transcriptional regulator [unclassified Moorella (in: firmicutes)]MDK2816961.1 hypothetical protein [Moorella sp. (in: firmicutes)]GEA14721.1 sigma-54-dependent Fis family transcriptional regulator [Moorella sp. E308F]GEA17905.1 sigma-54-dependent Fis family transcriptional regulator [Moorella sp. E306M]